MKKIIISLLLFLCIDAVAAEKAKVISIETDNSQMVLTVSGSGEVHFRHYGAKFEIPGTIGEYKSYRRWDYGTEPQAYPARGGRYFNGSALVITYPSGDINTELSYVNHNVTKLNDGITRTVVNLADSKTGLEVALYYDAYKDTDVIVSHSEITNTGRKTVHLDSYASSSVHLNADRYLLTHFYGAWRCSCWTTAGSAAGTIRATAPIRDARRRLCSSCQGWMMTNPTESPS